MSISVNEKRRSKPMNEKPSILVLEDDEEWYDIIHRHLGDEYDVVHASTLKAAAEWLEIRTFRLAIVDLQLDEINTEDRSGYELVEELGRTEILRDMSVIILSVHDEPEELRKGFKEFHIHDFISKKYFLDLDPSFRDVVNEAIAASYGGVDGSDWSNPE
jgi:CheY-like chemotaxis protein